MTTHSHHVGRPSVDMASLALLVVSILSGILAYALITDQGQNPLILVPAVVGAVIGATKLVKRQAPRD